MVIAAVIAAGLIGASVLLGKRARSPLKDTPYESGMAPVGSAS
jgi:NADH:ubiquinone oxidoreductase subunit 3 (subunit A)